MGSRSLCSTLLVLALLLHIDFTNAQRGFRCSYCEGNRTNAFNRNLNKLSSILTSNIRTGNGFYNISVGQEPDKVYSVAVCRGDLLVDDCRSCLSDAATNLQRIICPANNNSIGFYDTRCMMRYSYRPISGILKTAPNCNKTYSWRVQKPYVNKFRQKSTELFSRLVKTAAAGNLSYKFGVGTINVTASLQIYAATVCSPDLSPSDCSTCLQEALSRLQVCCGDQQGAAVFLPSCSVQINNYPFFNLDNRNSLASVPSPFTHPLNHTRRSKQAGLDMYIIFGIVAALLIPISLFLYFSRRARGSKKGFETENNDDQIRCVDFMRFDFNAIQAATQNFSYDKRLGMGCSARVYKGILLGEQEIAVKRLLKIDKDDEQKFNNEVLLLTNLQHRNLVKLLGFCVQEEKRLLICEFVPNESLDWFLHDPAKRAGLDWETRYNNVIQGIARGLCYLHEDSQLTVIHRDLKPSNILLGVDMKPKISNFSKASHVHEDQTRGATNPIKGTHGYMAPEFAEHGIYSVKSDVFSFGILLLEIICGQLVSSFSGGENDKDLVSYVWRKWSEGTALDVVDPLLQKLESHTIQLYRCIKVALLCVQENPTHRPTMVNVTLMLNNDTTAIKEPSNPASSCYL